MTGNIIVMSILGVALWAVLIVCVLAIVRMLDDTQKERDNEQEVSIRAGLEEKQSDPWLVERARREGQL